MWKKGCLLWLCLSKQGWLANYGPWARSRPLSHLIQSTDMGLQQHSTVGNFSSGCFPLSPQGKASATATFLQPLGGRGGRERWKQQQLGPSTDHPPAHLWPKLVLSSPQPKKSTTVLKNSDSMVSLETLMWGTTAVTNMAGNCLNYANKSDLLQFHPRFLL